MAGGRGLRVECLPLPRCAEAAVVAAAQAEWLSPELRVGQQVHPEGPGDTKEAIRAATGYEALEVIGQGSSSVVYRAAGQGGGPAVALKVMRRADQETACMARREYDLLKSLSHPNIIGAVGCVATGACVAVALELFEGRPLKAAIAAVPRGRLEAVTSLALFGQLLDALAYLHGRNVLHRDVKADNILVAPDLQDLKLVDFNIARRAEGAGVLTPTFTRRYASPEVLAGEPPGEPHDVWASGLCLHLMATGRLPRSSSAGGQLELAATVPPLPAEAGEEAAAALCRTLLGQALREDWRLRPSATRLLAALEAGEGGAAV